MLTVLVVVTHVGLLLGASEAGRLNCFFGDLDVLLVGRTRDTGVNSEVVEWGAGLVVRARRSVYGCLVLGLRAETLTVLTLSDVNRACVRLRGGVNVNVSIGVLRARSGRTGRCCQLGCLPCMGDARRFLGQPVIPPGPGRGATER